jgi:hypothetical protein
MNKWTTTAGLPALLAGALLIAGCSEPLAPKRGGLAAPSFATAAPLGPASGITLDQINGTGNESGTILVKGFNPTNPHRGDAIVATFFWLGSTNIITSVSDVLTTNPYTPVGNTYTLVDYVTTGGISMATYVATNVQNFPDPNDPATGIVLAVEATLSAPVTDGGVMLSSWIGVNAVAAQALGAHSSAAGSGSAATTADPGGIAVGAGALAYAVTMSNALVGSQPPAAFTYLNNTSDAVFKADGEYAIQAKVGAVDPQWTWSFNSPSSWLASVLALNPPLHLVVTVQPSTTLPFMTIRPAVQVAAVDALGNTVTSFSGSVTIAIGRNQGMLMAGTLSGTKTVTAVNGVATFGDLSIDQVGNGYTLVATAAGVAGVESATFNIGAF